MKDPRAGSWAVIGLCLLLLGKWALLPSVAPVLLVLPPVMGRWAMVMAMWLFPDVRKSGAAVYFREGFGASQMAIASAITVLIVVGVAAISMPIVALLLAFVPILVWLFGRWAMRRLGGGLTGDIYGAVCEMTELVCLMFLCVL